jgi:MoaA/NifB/PqqE/SkfB family radical SAM enzyme
LYELDFRCEMCRREYRFRDGKLKELKVERDLVAEQRAMRKAAVDAFRGRRCLICGGPLDAWLACDWCHARYSVESGELVPRAEEAVQPKPRMRDYYATQK